jgi:primosomal protein N' (replication factor Y)
VIFLEFDQHLLATRLSASEDAIALVVRAGRMVGGRGQRGSGSVLVQTRIPDHPVITAAVRADPGSLAASELALRRQLSLPPFCAVAMVSGPAADEYAAALAASSGREVPAAKGVSVVSLGPERWLVRGADHRALCDHLARTPRPAGRLRVSVDPRDV